MLSLAHLWMLAAALLLDAIVGDPDWLWRRVPHPVALLGRLVAHLDQRTNHDTASPLARRLAGILAIAVIAWLGLAFGYAIELVFSAFPHGWIGTVIAAAILLAGRSLAVHVRAVYDAFATGGLAAARTAVSRIVGRDPQALDEAGVSRAAIESLAENFSDAVVAPAFWFAILGLPGMLAYKAINTADSMIGHLSPRHRDFGWAAARLDDLVNLPASRIAGCLVALAAPAVGGSIATAFAVMRRDAGQHRSPNAGWPESA
ncbi:MAG: cobalamin biosynthesis protein CobD, partial [Rhizobiales bacterium]|nr:cobalamin biosynthesis protein CobD [Hyphomicrobiales bacterium]